MQVDCQVRVGFHLDRCFRRVELLSSRVLRMNRYISDTISMKDRRNCYRDSVYHRVPNNIALLHVPTGHDDDSPQRPFLCNAWQFLSLCQSPFCLR